MNRDPWSRQKGESRQAFEAFCVYRDLGRIRSQEKVANELGKSAQLMSRWSSKWGWVERVAAWEEELDRQNRLAQIEDRKEMAKRHINEAMMFQQKVLERMRELKPSELTPNDMARWFETAVKIERLSRGETTEITKQEHSGNIDISERTKEIEKRLFGDE